MSIVRPSVVSSDSFRVLHPVQDGSGSYQDYGAKLSVWTGPNRVLSLPWPVASGPFEPSFDEWLAAWEKGTGEKCFCYSKFLRPVNPVSGNMRISIQNAGGYIKTLRKWKYKTCTTGNATAIVKYTLMSVDWNPMIVTYASQPVPALDDPTVSVTISETDLVDWSTAAKSLTSELDNQFSTTYTQHEVEFTGLQDKLYYGVKAEISYYSPGVFAQPAAPVQIGDELTITKSSYVDVFYGCPANCAAIGATCDDLVGQTDTGTVDYCEYTGEYIANLDCSLDCVEDPDWPGYYAVYKVCRYTLRVTSTTCEEAVNASQVTSTGNVQIMTDQPFLEIGIVSKSRSSNKVTLTCATPHGLQTYAGTPVFLGRTWYQQPTLWTGSASTTWPRPMELHDFDLAISSSEWSGTKTKVTLAGAHGLASGKTLSIRGATYIPDGNYTVSNVQPTSVEISGHYGPATGAVTQTGYAYAETFLPAGWQFSGFEIVDAYSFKYSNTGANVGTTACTGILRVW